LFGVDREIEKRTYLNRSPDKKMIYLHCRREHLLSTPSPLDWLPLRQLPTYQPPEENGSEENGPNKKS